MRAIFTAAFTVALIAGPALADTLVVPIDHSVRLSVRGQAASVVVGNPQVADVTVVDTHTLFVSGRGYGETDVVVLDGAGRTIYSGDVTVSAANVGRLSVYRGADRTDFACAPACSVSTRSPTMPTKEGALSGGGGAAAAPSPLGALAAGAAGVTSGIGNAVSSAGSAAGGQGQSPS